jgi:hypothetical protein
VVFVHDDFCILMSLALPFAMHATPSGHSSQVLLQDPTLVRELSVQLLSYPGAPGPGPLADLFKLLSVPWLSDLLVKRPIAGDEVSFHDSTVCGTSFECSSQSCWLDL